MKKLWIVSLLTLILIAVSTSLIAAQSSSSDRYLYYQFYYDDTAAANTAPCSSGSVTGAAYPVCNFYNALSFLDVLSQKNQIICTLGYSQFPTTTTELQSTSLHSSNLVKETDAMINNTAQLVHNNNGLFLISFGGQGDTSLQACYTNGISAQNLANFLSKIVTTYQSDGIDINIQAINVVATVGQYTYVQWIGDVIKALSPQISFLTLSVPGQSYAYTTTFTPLIQAVWKNNVTYINFIEYASLKCPQILLYNLYSFVFSYGPYLPTATSNLSFNTAPNKAFLNQIYYDLKQYNNLPNFLIPFSKMAVIINILPQTQITPPLCPQICHNTQGIDYQTLTNCYTPTPKNYFYGFNNNKSYSELSFLTNYALSVGLAGLTLYNIYEEYTTFNSAFPLSVNIIRKFQTPFIPLRTTNPAAKTTRSIQGKKGA